MYIIRTYYVHDNARAYIYSLQTFLETEALFFKRGSTKNCELLTRFTCTWFDACVKWLSTLFISTFYHNFIILWHSLFYFHRESIQLIWKILSRRRSIERNFRVVTLYPSFFKYSVKHSRKFRYSFHLRWFLFVSKWIN